jgi:hypothetical protein
VTIPLIGEFPYLHIVTVYSFGLNIEKAWIFSETHGLFMP